MEIQVERRKKPRVPLDSRAEVHVGGQVFLAPTIDVAAMGMALASPFQWKIGRTMRIEFVLPDQSEPIHTGAILVRQELRSGDCIWGLKFTDLDSKCLGRIEQHVREFLMARAKNRYQGQLNRRYAGKRKQSTSADDYDKGTIKRLFRAALRKMRD